MCFWKPINTCAAASAEEMGGTRVMLTGLWSVTWRVWPWKRESSFSLATQSPKFSPYALCAVVPLLDASTLTTAEETLVKTAYSTVVELAPVRHHNSLSSLFLFLLAMSSRHLRQVSTAWNLSMRRRLCKQSLLFTWIYELMATRREI